MVMVVLAVPLDVRIGKEQARRGLYAKYSPNCAHGRINEHARARFLTHAHMHAIQYVFQFMFVCVCMCMHLCVYVCMRVIYALSCACVNASMCVHKFVVMSRISVCMNVCVRLLFF